GGPSPTTTTVVSSLNPSTFGQSVTFTATVTGGTAPTGTVQFKDGATSLGAPVVLTGTTATLTTAALSVGTHPITAVYSGDSSNGGSLSPALSQMVNGVAPAATTTGVVSSLNPSLVGQAVTFTATVNGTSPTGMVQFTDGASVLGTGAVNAGAATFTTATLTLGSHPITAIYSGDAANAPSTSAVLIQIVATAGGTTPPSEPAPTLSTWALLLLCAALLGVTLHRLAGRLDR
ncbi:MAG: Ig-like domain-containing protein, partial [Dokdonella sp.]